MVGQFAPSLFFPSWAANQIWRVGEKRERETGDKKWPVGLVWQSAAAIQCAVCQLFACSFFTTYQYEGGLHHLPIVWNVLPHTFLVCQIQTFTCLYMYHSPSNIWAPLFFIHYLTWFPLTRRSFATQSTDGACLLSKNIHCSHV